MSRSRRLARSLVVIAAGCLMVASTTGSTRAIQKAFARCERYYAQQSASFDRYARKVGTLTLTKISVADDKGASPEQLTAIANEAIAKMQLKSNRTYEAIFNQHDKNVAKLTSLNADTNDLVQLGYLFGDSTSVVIQITQDIADGIQNALAAEIAD